jgi:hypothetical protein
VAFVVGGLEVVMMCDFSWNKGKYFSNSESWMSEQLKKEVLLGNFKSSESSRNNFV